MTKSLQHTLEQEAEVLRRRSMRTLHNCLTHTHLMYHLMNTISDEELVEMKIDLLDVAGAVMQYMIWEEAGMNKRVVLDADL